MSDKTERLKRLDDHKLIDIVKNYRQYGYGEDLRKAAISLLNERGIDEEQLRLSGQFENHTYDTADRYFKSFKRNSKIAFVLYILTFLFFFVFPGVLAGVELGMTLLLLSLLSGTGFFIFLLKSFFDQDRFYRAAGGQEASQGALSYFLLGMPLYIITFFYANRQMEERMKQIS